MAERTAVLCVAELAEEQHTAWDALSQSRGVYADIYDSSTWFRAWAEVAAKREVGRVRIAAVLESDRPVALLPMLPERFGRWRSAATEFRYRSGPVVAGEQPDDAVFGLLAEQLASAGARELLLYRLPLRDPATGALVTALTEAGYRARLRVVAHDQLMPADAGWEGHERRLHGFARYAERMVGRISSLWDVTMDTYGTSPEWPVETGFAVYTEIQRLSWKGTLSPTVRAHRTAVLRRAERNGWARLYILRVGDVPVAGHVWFRIGDVATWWSTAYDQRLAALSPGTVVQWWAQQRVFADPPPRLVDMLPGPNPQKDRLTVQRPPLVMVEAVRRGSVAIGRGTDEVRRVASAAKRRARGARSGRRSAAHQEPVARTRTLRVGPVPDRSRSVSTTTADAVMLRYLTVACGQPNVETMTGRWCPADEWVRVGDAPLALLRLGAVQPDGTRPVREIVRVATDRPISDVVAIAAAGLDQPLGVTVPAADGDTGGPPTEEHVPPLPWPTRFNSTEPSQTS
jgi:hypothetical protein